MSDLTLSQDEIDALLMGGSVSPSASKKQLNDFEKTSFQQILSEASQQQANSLSGMVEGVGLSLDLEELELLDRDGFLDQLSKDQEVVELRVDLSGDISGQHGLYLSSDHALKLVAMVMGQNEVELNGAAINALEEVASQFTAGFVNYLSSKLNKNITPSPASGQKFPKALISTPDDDLVTVKWSMKLGKDSIQIIEFYTYSMVQKVVGPDPNKGAKAAAQGAPSAQQGNQPAAAMGQMPPMGGFVPGYGTPPPGWGMPPQPQGMGQMPNMPPNMMGGYPGAPMMGVPPGQMPYYPNVQNVQFSNLNPTPDIKDLSNIGLLMDVAMEVTVELGRAKRQIKDILGMGEGTIIQLDKLAGEAVDILVNNKLIAKGEVVVIEENFGVRVTEIVTNPDKGKDT